MIETIPSAIATLKSDAWRMEIVIANAETGIVINMPLGATDQEIVQLLTILAEGKRPIRRRNKYRFGTEGETILRAMLEREEYRNAVISAVLGACARLKSSRWIRHAAAFLAKWSPPPATSLMR